VDNGPPPLSVSLSHPKLRSLYDYWAGKRAGRPVLAADELDPAELRRWIGHLVVVDATGEGAFVYSYYGATLEKAFGRSMAGQSLELLPESQRSILRDEYQTVRIDRQPVTRTYTADFNGATATWERLVLPLSSDGAGIDKLLVAAYRLDEGSPH
jgi:hypothetical protein